MRQIIFFELINQQIIFDLNLCHVDTKRKKFKDQKNTDTEKHPPWISLSKMRTFQCQHLSRIRPKYSFKIDNQLQWRQMWAYSAASRRRQWMTTSTLNCWLKTPFLSLIIILRPLTYRLASSKVILFTIQRATINKKISERQVLEELPRRVTWSRAHQRCSNDKFAKTRWLPWRSISYR